MPNFPYLGDGAAQWLIVVVSFISTIVSAWAVWLVRKSLDSTDLALEEAREANRLTRLEARPWLDFRIVDFSGLQFPTFEELHKNVCVIPTFKVHNYGKSPAIDVSFQLAAFYGKGGNGQEGPEIILAHDRADPLALHTTIFPESEAIERSELLVSLLAESKAHDEGSNGTLSLWLTIGVVYWDIYGNKFATTRQYTARLDECRSHPERVNDLLRELGFALKYH